MIFLAAICLLLPRHIIDAKVVDSIFAKAKQTFTQLKVPGKFVSLLRFFLQSE